MTAILWIMAVMAWLNVPFALPAVQRRMPNLRRVIGTITLAAIFVFFGTSLFGGDPLGIDSIAWFVWGSGMAIDFTVTAWAIRPARDVATT